MYLSAYLLSSAATMMINNFEQEQNNKEYLTALKLIQGFSKEQNQDLSRNAANKLIITNIEKGSINCTDKQIISR